MTAAQPSRSNSAGYATADQLVALARFVRELTAASRETRWHVPGMVVSHGDAEEEEIVVGLRWVSAGEGEYVAEIR